MCVCECVIERVFSRFSANRNDYNLQPCDCRERSDNSNCQIYPSLTCQVNYFNLHGVFGS